MPKVPTRCQPASLNRALWQRRTRVLGGAGSVDGLQSQGASLSRTKLSSVPSYADRTDDASECSEAPRLAALDAGRV